MSACTYTGCPVPSAGPGDGCPFHAADRAALPPEYGGFYPSEWTPENREQRFIAACNAAEKARYAIEAARAERDTLAKRVEELTRELADADDLQAVLRKETARAEDRADALAKALRGLVVDGCVRTCFGDDTCCAHTPECAAARAALGDKP